MEKIQSYKDSLEQILLRDTIAISPIEKFTAEIYLIEPCTFFSGMADGLHHLLRGALPDPRRGPDHLVRHLLQTATKEEAQLRHQEG